MVGSDYFELELRGNVAQHRGPAFAKILGLGALFVLAGWAALTSIYILLHDDLLSAALQERQHMQAGYEDRIAGLRGEIGAITGQLMLNEDQFEVKVSRIRERQSLLESRQNKLSTLANDPRQLRAASIADRSRAEVTGSTEPAHDRVSENSSQDAQGGPPGPGTIRLAFSAPSFPRTVSRLPFTSLGETGLPPQPLNRADADLQKLVSNQNSLESEQFAELTRMEEDAESAIRILTDTITRIGFTPRLALDSLNAAAPSSYISSGQPARVQVTPTPITPATNFDLQLQRVRARLDRANALFLASLQYPIRRPLPAEKTITSPYGSRIDPFHRRLSFHSGVDIRAPSGFPVRATAAGIVVSAGNAGGYGLRVEVSHGAGLITRYAHMSAIDVREGQRISAGDIVGKVGSTGRSTGPHLHYEVRRAGNTIDPMRMVQAGEELLVN
jgi:murein DD-endopeptidase MepM/ murein hydrolase activator NlpD